MDKLRSWFRRNVMGEPDRKYRWNRDPLVLQVLRLEKRANNLPWQPKDLFDVR